MSTTAKRGAAARADTDGSGDYTAALQALTDLAAGEGHIDAEAQRHAIADAVVKARSAARYRSRLTPRLWDLLVPLLYQPIPQGYIEHREARQSRDEAGLPFDTTGVRSAQVQIDRMNDVLGMLHWDFLPRYPSQAGNVCHVVVIAGNRLAGVRLDETGQLVVPDGAEVLVRREGWGGYGRGKLGDAFKGAETNALKRALARFGPGSEVYRQDFDDDPSRPEVEQPPVLGAGAPPAPAPAAAAGPEPDWREELAGLLAKDDRNQALRQRASELMTQLDAPARQQVQELNAANVKGRLEDLIARCEAAVEADAPEEPAQQELPEAGGQG